MMSSQNVPTPVWLRRGEYVLTAEAAARLADNVHVEEEDEE